MVIPTHRFYCLTDLFFFMCSEEAFNGRYLSGLIPFLVIHYSEWMDKTPFIRYDQRKVLFSESKQLAALSYYFLLLCNRRGSGHFSVKD